MNPIPSKAILLILLSIAPAVTGCNSYITRIIGDSIANIAAPIPPAPRQTLSPILNNVGIAVTWVGHATVVIQIHDKIFITDPVFTKTVGLIAHRKVGLGIVPDSLKRVDATLISHTHFDHLSYGSLAMLPKNGTLLVPFGGVEYVPEFGFEETRALSAWEVWERDGVRITAVPVQHFGGRYGIDSQWNDEPAYTGWVIEYNGRTVFIGGDTGYDPSLFKEIGRRFSDAKQIDLAILPIAPSRSEGLGGGVHVSPAGAVQILQDLNAKMMIPMHYATFFQGSETPRSFSLELLQRAAERAGLVGRVRILEIGGQWIMGFGK
jgi:L-ascorbate metabolism protein UlaG (beta-lactamase superfamily)